MEIKKRFGKGLRKVRLSQKLTQEDLGLRIDANQAYISLIERGGVNVTLETIERLAAALGVEPDAFFE